jgi:DNA-binding transcriptional MocR family regulator
VLAELAAGGRVAEALGYPPRTGSAAHQESGARWLARFGLAASPSEVVLTAGAQHGLLLALATLTRPGDVVVTEALTYPGVIAAARLLRLDLRGLRTDERGLLPEAFAAACRRQPPAALYCTPTLQNPTATLMPDDRREAIAGIAREHGVAVIEDDIYAFLLDHPPRPSAARVPDLGYYLTSLSKGVAPALRLGYLRLPRAAVAVAGEVAMATTVMPSLLLAEIATRLVDSGAAVRIAAERRVRAARRQALARERIGPWVAPGSHPAALHLWLTLPDPWRAEAFAGRAQERGVAVASAETFAVGRSAAPHAVRLSVGVVPEPSLRRACDALAELVDRPQGLGFDAL